MSEKSRENPALEPGAQSEPADDRRERPARNAKPEPNRQPEPRRHRDFAGEEGLADNDVRKQNEAA